MCEAFLCRSLSNRIVWREKKERRHVRFEERPKEEERKRKLSSLVSFCSDVIERERVEERETEKWEEAELWTIEQENYPGKLCWRQEQDNASNIFEIDVFFFFFSFFFSRCWNEMDAFIINSRSKRLWTEAGEKLRTVETQSSVTAALAEVCWCVTV